MAKPKVNYTDEQTQDLITRYEGGQSVEDIAEAVGRAVRSVRAKLVREGVYVAPEKPVKEPRDEGPTKKELLNDFEVLVKAYAKTPFSVDGLMQANKESITNLIAFVTDLAGHDAVAEDAE